MVVLVSGGRDFDNFDLVCEVLDEVLSWSDDGHVTIVNGGARGADQLSTQWAKERGESFIEVPIAKDPQHRVEINARFDWVKDGKVAGPMRNAFMISEYRPAQAVVFPGDKGTRDMLVRLFDAGVNTWSVGR